jgi:hypothetical protein
MHTPTRNYNYNRAGVAMLTLKAWLCRITQTSFTLSPTGKRVLQAVIERGGRAIRLTHRFFGERYKPAGKLFDLCCQGRLLELSVAGAFARFARLDRAACLLLNAVTGEVATTQWGCDHAVDATKSERVKE